VVVLVIKGKYQATEDAAATHRGDKDMGRGVSATYLAFCFEADNGLVEQNVLHYSTPAELGLLMIIGILLMIIGIFKSLAQGYAQASWRLWVLR
jgi:hypothetical protein